MHFFEENEFGLTEVFHYADLRKITQAEILIPQIYAGPMSITRKIFRVEGTYSSLAYVERILPIVRIFSFIGVYMYSTYAS